MKALSIVSPCKRSFTNHPMLFSVIILIIVSLFPRFWMITTYPPIMLDESANFRDMIQIIETNSYYPALPQWDGSQAILDYYPTLFFLRIAVFDQLFAIRLVSILWSLGGILCLFFILKKYTTTFITFCTTLLFSYSYYYLHFSRVGWTTIHATVLGIAALLCILSAYQRKSLLLSIISGVLAALTFYSYRAGALYIAAIIIFLCIKMVTSPSQRTTIIKLAAVFIITTISFSSPWLYYILTNWQQYNLRSHVVSIMNIQYPYQEISSFHEVLWYQIRTTITAWLLMIPIQGNAGTIENPRYLPLSFPPISYLVIPLYISGIGIAIKRWKTTYLWLFIYLAGLLLGQILTLYPPNGSRALIILPVIYLFIGLSLAALYQKLKHIKNIKSYIVLYCVCTAVLDFLFYQYWMSWIHI